jgi:hypothetical protein
MKRLLILTLLCGALAACSPRDGGPAPAASSPGAAEAALPQTSVIDGQDCLTDAGLRQRGWPLVDRDVWDALPRVRDWAAITGARRQAREREGLPADGVDAVYLQGREQIVGLTAWHEPRPVCVQVRDSELWAAVLDERFRQQPQWHGPLVPSRDFNALDLSYYNRIFGTVCYDSEKHEHWCFAPAALVIDGKARTVTLQLDRTNMPGYGTPLRVEGQAGYWVFVPIEDGWKVYRDDDVSRPGHRDINPDRDPPWHTLRLAGK